VPLGPGQHDPAKPEQTAAHRRTSSGAVRLHSRHQSTRSGVEHDVFIWQCSFSFLGSLGGTTAYRMAADLSRPGLRSPPVRREMKNVASATIDLLRTHLLVEEILDSHREHAAGDERGWASYSWRPCYRPIRTGRSQERWANIRADTPTTGDLVVDRDRTDPPASVPCLIHLSLRRLRRTLCPDTSPAETTPGLAALRSGRSPRDFATGATQRTWGLRTIPPTSRGLPRRDFRPFRVSRPPRRW
jgi:hypothetical protein